MEHGTNVQQQYNDMIYMKYMIIKKISRHNVIKITPQAIASVEI